MIPQAYITEWRAHAPWPDDAQVEHDLVLSRVVVELFRLPEIAKSFALRGGTALNKLFVPKPVRYSEDIDLVQVAPGAIGPFVEMIRGKLDGLLGIPGRSSSEKMFTMTYKFDSEIAPVQRLKLKLEINTREHFSVLGYEARRLSVNSRWFGGEADIVTYRIDELMGTKLRALYQRKKGRDLFDLWLCLNHGFIDPEAVIACFHRYMEAEEHPVTRAAFERNLDDKMRDKGFMGDIGPLLAADVSYDAESALRVVRGALIERLE